MSISIEEFITDFAYKLNNEQVSVFIGSGVSTELKLPNWKDLFKDIAAKISLNIDEIDDYYQLAQYYSNKYSVSDLKRSILPKIQTLNTDSPTLNNLLDLKFHSIWTTNFDNAIENCLFSKKINYLKVHNDKDLACINMNDYPIIYKINGDISDLDNIILTQSDWENFTYKRPTMLNFLNKELVSNTFLFIGYSFKDKLVKTSLSTIQQFVGNNGMHHYAIFEKDNKIEFKYYIDDLEKNYNVKAVLVEKYTDVPEILKQIYLKTIERNVFISGRLDDYNEETELFANNLLNCLAVELLEKEFNICTGMGRKIGYFVAGPSIQYLLSKGIHKIDKRIQIRPFDDNLTAKDFSSYRNYLISQNNIAIFVFGQKFVNGISQNSKGVIEEFQIAKKMNKIIIPIGSTGFAAREIFDAVKANIVDFPYLEPYYTVLENETDINKICKTVASIIDSVVNIY